eukprot:5874675-Alexandrium_andersonii.AAC.1
MQAGPLVQAGAGGGGGVSPPPPPRCGPGPPVAPCDARAGHPRGGGLRGAQRPWVRALGAERPGH